MSEANSPSKNRSIPGAGAEQLAELFHATYERLAPEFGYTTRTPEKLWYIECNKCGRQDNPGYGCNALQPDGSRCNGTMRRTRLLFESNFGTPPDPRGAVETAGEPSEVWACVSKGISPPYVRFFESKAEMEAYEWRDDSVSPNRYRPAEKTTPEQS